MRLPLRLRSRDEQKAVFSRSSYREFCDKANKDFWNKLADGSSVKNMSFKEFNKKADDDFDKGYPHTTKDVLLTDKNMDMKRTWFGADRSYEQFYYEDKPSKFSMSPDESYDDLDYEAPVAAGVFSGKSRYDYESGKSKLEAELKPRLGDRAGWVDIKYDPDLTYIQNKKVAEKDFSAILDTKYSLTQDLSLPELEKERRGLMKKLNDMNESSDRDMRSAIVKRLDQVNDVLDKKSPKFSIDEYGAVSGRMYGKLKKDLDEGLIAGQLTREQYNLELDKLESKNVKKD